MKKEVLVSLDNITKIFDRKKILDDVSFDINKGDIIGLIGRSGCGKSTLIKVLVGYYKPDRGSIIFNDIDVTKRFNKVKELVGYTTQDNSFYEKLTVYENMSYYANLYNVLIRHRKNRINELLKSVYLESSKNILAENISGGMKRRLDFAISLLHSPQLVIMDEPTAGLDPLLVENFWQIVRYIAYKDKITVLVSSHQLSEIKNNCTKAAVMSRGKIHIIDITEHTNIEHRFKELTQ